MYSKSLMLKDKPAVGDVTEIVPVAILHDG